MLAKIKTSKKQKLTFLVRIGVGGRITIPKPLCDALGIKPGDYLSVKIKNGAIVMTPVKRKRIK